MPIAPPLSPSSSHGTPSPSRGLFLTRSPHQLVERTIFAGAWLLSRINATSRSVANFLLGIRHRVLLRKGQIPAHSDVVKPYGSDSRRRPNTAKRCACENERTSPVTVQSPTMSTGTPPHPSSTEDLTLAYAIHMQRAFITIREEIPRGRELDTSDILRALVLVNVEFYPCFHGLDAFSAPSIDFVHPFSVVCLPTRPSRYRHGQCRVFSFEFPRFGVAFLSGFIIFLLSSMSLAPMFAVAR
ncbi:hypothetical protein C8J57DRAFT_1243915 [Mycena rebaudengoi]|nr:hypothetical protein C8J57DRAFT_1243915 [Mycena rebaudengoi]